MFKKSFLTALLFSMLTVSSMAEETQNTAGIEELSPIFQCDEEYNICEEKCGDSFPNTCIEQCQIHIDQCYANAYEETDDTPPVIDEEQESETVPPSENTENESDKVSPEVE